LIPPAWGRAQEQGEERLYEGVLVGGPEEFPVFRVEPLRGTPGVRLGELAHAILEE